MRKIYLSIIALAMFSFVAVSQDLVTNGGFETWSQTDLPDSWTNETGTILSQETGTTHAGSASAMNVDLTTGSQSSTDFRQTISVIAGNTYNVSVWVYHLDGLSQARLYVDGWQDYSDNTLTDQWQEITYAYTPSATGDVEVGLRYYDQTGFVDHSYIIVDDFAVIDPNFTLDPSLNISTPMENDYSMSTDVTVEFVVGNFDVAAAGGDGHINWFIDGAMTSKDNVDPIALTGLADGPHQLIMKLVDNNNDDLTPLVADTVNFNVASNPMNAAVGDIAIIQISSDSPDGFVFVALEDLPGNSYVNFTDNAWQNVSAGVDTFKTSENLLTWFTPAAGVARNTIVSYRDGAGVSLGGTTGAMSGISSSGDQVFVFNGTLSNPTSFVFAISPAGNWIDENLYPDSIPDSHSSFLPDALTDGVNALHFDPSEDNGYYTVTPLAVTDKATALTSICDYATNWLTEGDGSSWQENTYWAFSVNVNNIVTSGNVFYPNPVNDVLTVKGQNISSVEIIDINGKTQRLINNVKTVQNINVSNLKQGIYFVKISDEKGTKVSKLIKL